MLKKEVVSDVFQFYKYISILALESQVKLTYYCGSLERFRH